MSTLLTELEKVYSIREVRAFPPMHGTNSSTIHVNYFYLLDFIEGETRKTPRIKVLDYGCGDGAVVEEGLSRGMDIHGADIFYDGSDSYNVVRQKGLLGNRILAISNNRVGFPDGSFDLIVSNQVFEHVEDMEAVLSEINRLLKPGGKFLCLFPSRDVWREGHCGVPFLHWFPKRSRIRYIYIYMMRSLGIGKYKSNLPKKQWIEHVLGWLDRYCFYRSRSAIKQSFGTYFKVHFIEYDYVSFRLKATRLSSLEPVSRFPFTRPFVNELFRKLGGLVMFCEKR